MGSDYKRLLQNAKDAKLVAEIALRKAIDDIEKYERLLAEEKIIQQKAAEEAKKAAKAAKKGPIPCSKGRDDVREKYVVRNPKGTYANAYGAPDDTCEEVYLVRTFGNTKNAVWYSGGNKNAVHKTELLKRGNKREKHTLDTIGEFQSWGTWYAVLWRCQKDDHSNCEHECECQKILISECNEPDHSNCDHDHSKCKHHSNCKNRFHNSDNADTFGDSQVSAPSVGPEPLGLEGDTLNKINGVYTKNGAVPEWFKKGNVKTYFQGGGGIDFNLVDNSTITWTPEESCPTCVNPKKRDGQYFDKSTKKMQSAKGKVHREDCTKCDKNKDGKPTGKLYGKERTATRDANGWWPKITDSTGTGKCRPHYVNGDCIIFFCAIQNKWHMCGKDGIIYYRVDNGETAALPSFGWNSIKMKGAKDAAPTIQ